mmetsp:Transcript_40111/g.72065  ORF Transcript_40111/g.72065 Transcript_40111/m.72065 type:complete len:584 (-) Transcript_40111:92-1843(-)|eukprot:CAMPEP_0197637454 /NCGR_PEP_ID=MMETSP1338-20131121/12678_1 /TAXON_ID=43686 ORGANISM="Pelagodinium beii, Strain RCC1491" /NCGR_SAMPLE_ID=MMETSP1338 /ASSEMBLY_ACC=CAM_ASM_000754 /LENGTH=583 /DNA_ID=CAMNT_0043209881 /DNA_START=32 /DNA_END=1783 /DNA_ORIENTATION=-
MAENLASALRPTFQTRLVSLPGDSEHNFQEANTFITCTSDGCLAATDGQLLELQFQNAGNAIKAYFKKPRQWTARSWSADRHALYALQRQPQADDVQAVVVEIQPETMELYVVDERQHVWALDPYGSERFVASVRLWDVGDWVDRPKGWFHVLPVHGLAFFSFADSRLTLLETKAGCFSWVMPQDEVKIYAAEISKFVIGAGEANEIRLFFIYKSQLWQWTLHLVATGHARDSQSSMFLEDAWAPRDDAGSGLSSNLIPISGRLPAPWDAPYPIPFGVATKDSVYCWRNSAYYDYYDNDEDERIPQHMCTQPELLRISLRTQEVQMCNIWDPDEPICAICDSRCLSWAGGDQNGKFCLLLHEGKLRFVDLECDILKPTWTENLLTSVDFSKLCGSVVLMPVNASDASPGFAISAAILAARCPHFAAVLQSGLSESQSGRIILDFPPKVVEAFVCYLHTDQFEQARPKTDEEALESGIFCIAVWVCADMYGTFRMRMLALEGLKRALRKTTAISLLQKCFVARPGTASPEIMNVCFSFCRMHWSSIAEQSEELIALVRNCPDLAVLLLRNVADFRQTILDKQDL